MDRKYKQLNDVQRYQIEAYLRSGKTQQSIADQLGVNGSTINREVRRNSTRTGRHRARQAACHADQRKERYGRPAS